MKPLILLFACFVPLCSILAAAWGLTASRIPRVLATRASAATILALMFAILAAAGVALLVSSFAS